MLAETDRTRTALLAAVSHDLRSPLSAVKAAVSSLRNTEIEWSPEDEEALLETVEEGADRLDDLVANLLDMSRIQMGVGQGARRRGRARVRRSSRRSSTLVRSRPRRRRRRPTGRDVVVADAGLLERVIANVIANALTLRAAATRASTSSRHGVGDRVVVRVVDHGPGVPAAQRSGCSSRSSGSGDVPRGEGVGLGLAVARGLTESMGGTLTAEDTPGGGLDRRPRPAVRREQAA